MVVLNQRGQGRDEQAEGHEGDEFGGILFVDRSMACTAPGGMLGRAHQ